MIEKKGKNILATKKIIRPIDVIRGLFSRESFSYFKKVIKE